MLQPSRSKYRFRFGDDYSTCDATQTCSNVIFGDYGIKAIENNEVSSKEIEAVRRVVARMTKRSGKFLIRIFPDKPITKKPLEVRQGKGKGAIDRYVARVRPGVVMFELMGINDADSVRILKEAIHKMSIRAIVVSRKEILV